MRAWGWPVLALVLLAALVSPVLASPSMPVVDGGTVWAGDAGVFQQWDDGAWVYVWRPAPGEPPPEARWPERVLGTQHELVFAGRQWNGGYLVKETNTVDSVSELVLVARDEGGEWYMALCAPGAAMDARAASIVQALKETRLEGE